MNNNIVFEKEVGDIRLVVSYDLEPQHPRQDNDNLGKIIGFFKESNVVDEVANNLADYDNWDDWSAGELHKDTLRLPVYALNHSGVRLSTTSFGDPWDSGQVGFIVAKRSEVRSWFGVKRVTEKVRTEAYEDMKNQIKWFDDYLNRTYYHLSAEENHGEAFEFSSGTLTKEDFEDVFKELPESFQPFLKELNGIL